MAIHTSENNDAPTAQRYEQKFKELGVRSTRELIRDHMYPSDRARLFLLITGESEALEYSPQVEVKNEGEEGTSWKYYGSESEIKDLAYLINTEFGFKTSSNGRISIYKEKDIIDEINRLKRSNVKDAAVKRRFGKIYGYPKDAIEAFVDGTCMSDDDYPLHMREHEYFKFLTYRLPKKNSEEAWNAYVNKMDKLRRENPQLYQDLLA